VERGGNYGWRCREGAHDFDRSGVCPDDLVDPVIEYDHGMPPLATNLVDAAGVGLLSAWVESLGNCR
jgi:hypothetical protein